jgi:hypothetical protein
MQFLWYGVVSLPSLEKMTENVFQTIAIQEQLIYHIISRTNIVVAVKHSHDVSVAPWVREQLLVMQHKFINREVHITSQNV